MTENKIDGRNSYAAYGTNKKIGRVSSSKKNLYFSSTEQTKIFKTIGTSTKSIDLILDVLKSF
jgi:hypothetical protein